MDQSRRDDRKLREVKGVLYRLQGSSAEPQPVGSRQAELGFRRGYIAGIVGTTTVMLTAAMVLVFGYALPGPEAISTPREEASLPKKVTPTPKDGADRQLASSKEPGPSGVVAGSAVSPKERPVASTTLSPTVEAAQALMSTGRVKAARQQLLAVASDGSPEVAWALARSYDPKHLKGLEGADAGPDVAEATRWYRTWHAAALKQGMITDSVSLEKIIGSMQP